MDVVDEGDNGGNEIGNDSNDRSRRDSVKSMLVYSGNCNDTKWTPIVNDIISIFTCGDEDNQSLFVCETFHELTVGPTWPRDCRGISWATPSVVQAQQFHEYYNIGSFLFHIDWTCIVNWMQCQICSQMMVDQFKSVKRTLLGQPKVSTYYLVHYYSTE